MPFLLHTKYSILSFSPFFYGFRHLVVGGDELSKINFMIAYIFNFMSKVKLRIVKNCEFARKLRSTCSVPFL